MELSYEPGESLGVSGAETAHQVVPSGWALRFPHDSSLDGDCPQKGGVALGKSALPVEAVPNEADS